MQARQPKQEHPRRGQPPTSRQQRLESIQDRLESLSSPSHRHARTEAERNALRTDVHAEQQAVAQKLRQLTAARAALRPPPTRHCCTAGRCPACTRHARTHFRIDHVRGHLQAEAAFLQGARARLDQLAESNAAVSPLGISPQHVDARLLEALRRVRQRVHTRGFVLMPQARKRTMLAHFQKVALGARTRAEGVARDVPPQVARLLKTVCTKSGRVCTECGCQACRALVGRARFLNEFRQLVLAQRETLDEIVHRLKELVFGRRRRRRQGFLSGLQRFQALLLNE